MEWRSGNLYPVLFQNWRYIITVCIYSPIAPLQLPFKELWVFRKFRQSFPNFCIPYLYAHWYWMGPEKLITVVSEPWCIQFLKACKHFWCCQISLQICQSPHQTNWATERGFAGDIGAIEIWLIEHSLALCFYYFLNQSFRSADRSLSVQK